MAFVNDKHNLVKGFGHPETPVGIKSDTIVKIKTKLWENAAVIDEYIDSARNLSGADIQILKGWKRGIKGPFFVMKHLKNYSVFLDDKNSVLYGIIGISGPIDEMVPGERLPMIAETVLLPYGDRIIYDSLFLLHNDEIGYEMNKTVQEHYKEIKEKKGIVASLAIHEEPKIPQKDE